MRPAIAVRRVTSLRALAGPFLLLASPALAQTPAMIRGRVLDAEGATVADQVVVLHRVSAEGGAQIASDTTDAMGRFALQAADVGALYFAATRYEDRLYIGEVLRPPLDGAAEYVLRVGVEGTAIDALMSDRAVQAPAGAVGSSLRWGLALIPLLALLALAGRALTRAGIPERRRLLARAARLDEEGPGEDPASFGERRARLVERIRNAPDP